MEKIDIAQQRGKSSDSAAAWKKKTSWSIMEKIDMAQQRGKSSHISAALKSCHKVASWKRKT